MGIISYAEAARALKNDALVDDDQFRDTVDMANQYAVDYCHRKFEYGTHTEFLPGSGSNFVVLNEDPIESITSVNIDWFGQFGTGTLVEPTTYHVEGRRLIYYAGFLPAPDPFYGSGLLAPTGEQVVKVVYAGGYYPTTESDASKPKMPATLRFAVKKIVAIEWARGISSEIFKAERIGDYSYSRAGMNAKEAPAYDDRITTVLDNYRRVVLG